MLPFLTPGKGLPFGKKAENTFVCVCLWNTHCVVRGKWALVKMQSEGELLRWFGTWKGLHARGKALAPFYASLSALFYKKVRELCAITQETFHHGLVSFYKIYCSIKLSFLLGWQVWCWFRGCLVPQGFATSQNKAPLWAGLHTVSSLPGMFLHISQGTAGNRPKSISGDTGNLVLCGSFFGVHSVPLVSLLCSITLKFAYSVIKNVLARKSWASICCFSFSLPEADCWINNL